MNHLTTVLFVDDEPWILHGIRRTLLNAPFNVLTVDTPEEALAVLRKQPIHVLISDIDMPGMTGLELLKIVRREFPTTLRMLLTGAGTVEATLAAINEGEVHRFFTKPFEVQLFRATMQSLGERIDKLRRDGDLDARRARRDEFHRWVEEAYPGTLVIGRNAADEVMLDPSLDDLRFLDGAAPLAS
jgi:YesN/AraC family two-component response regulator